MKSVIAVGGENLIDFVERQDDGDLPVYAAHPGGGPYNIAMAAGRQGGDVVYLTPISIDRLGQMLSRNLEESGVKLVAPKVSLPTSLAIVSIRDNTPSFQFYRDNTAERNITLPGLLHMLDEDPWAFHIGSLALAGGEDAQAWEEYFMAMQDKGVVTSLDPNVRPNLIPDNTAYIDRLERMIRHTDILKLSDEDMQWLYPDLSLDEAFDHICGLAGHGLKVMTKGAEGAMARSDTSAQFVASHKIDHLADTVGAGDTFMATILNWLREHGVTRRQDIHALDQNGLAQMLNHASVAAGINCTRQGCNPPTAPELAAALEA